MKLKKMRENSDVEPSKLALNAPGINKAFQRMGNEAHKSQSNTMLKDASNTKYFVERLNKPHNPMPASQVKAILSASADNPQDIENIAYQESAMKAKTAAEEAAETNYLGASDL